MKEPKQCALPLHQANYRKRFREESRLNLVRLLAELLIQAFKSAARATRRQMVARSVNVANERGTNADE